MPFTLTPENTLPTDASSATLVGRAWIPGLPGGPSPIVLRGDGVFDLSEHFPTVRDLLEEEAPLLSIRQVTGKFVCNIEALLANTGAHSDPTKPFLLAPVDLQVIKAAGVTFAASMIERVIEEKAGGDAAKADNVRAIVRESIGDNLRAVKPGSEQAMRLKALLIEQDMWSQYLEVGIGPDAEIFTKAPTLSAVGSGNEIGIHPGSKWNNPEPEVVLAVNSRGQICGATLGNDVNLRDVEGRSALLLGKAKDNNASCAIGPFIRLFDEQYDLDTVRACVVDLEVIGTEGYQLNGTSSMAQISRDLEDLTGQTLNNCHQYPDGFVLFLGTLFAPIEDRDKPGAGFTHKLGDRVRISSPLLGCLHNLVTYSDVAKPWTFGLGALIHNLGKRGLLSH